MAKSTVARRYAQALFNLLDASNVEAARNGLNALAESVNQSPHLRHLLASPVFTFEEKTDILGMLSDRLRSPAIMKDFWGQLVKKNRLPVLADIAKSFQELSDQQQGKQKVLITTARDLEGDELNRVKTELQAMVKKEVDLWVKRDPALLSGIQIKIGSKVYDSTVRGRLTKMQAFLAKG